MTESTWKILKLDWKTPGIFFFQKSGNSAGDEVRLSCMSHGPRA